MSASALGGANGGTPTPAAANYAPSNASANSISFRQPGSEESFHESRHGWIVLSATWVLAAAYMAVHLRVGWYPPDAGMLAQEALRTLHGQVPYRDFIEIYTGGLTYLNALAFRLFGVNLFSMRIPLFLFFLAWVPSLYFIARRFTGPIAAAGITLLSVVWSVPNYPEAMPSWYNLFLASWGTLALLRFIESEKKRWLWIAGLCGGLSFLVKISGLYFVAAGLLFLVYREQSLARREPTRGNVGGRTYRLFVTLGLAAFLAELLRLVYQQPTFTEFVHFVLPSGCLVALLLWQAWSEPASSGANRFRKLIGMGLPFLAGAFVPVAVFLLWYAHEHALAVWFRGIFVLSMRHTVLAALQAPSPLTAVGLIPMALVLYLSFSRSKWASWAAAIGMVVLLAAGRVSVHVYELLGLSLPMAIPLLALAAPVCLLRLPSLRAPAKDKIFLVSAVAIVCALVQFPYGSPAYFGYVVPLVVLAMLAVLSAVPRARTVPMAALLSFYFLFAVWLHTPVYFITMRVGPHDPLTLSSLDLPRVGGLQVPAGEVPEFENLVHLIHEHARGRFIYCTPDCPEVYFLSGYRNPTKTIYDFLDPDFLDPAAREIRLLNTLAGHRVSLVVLAPPNPLLSGSPSPGLKAALDARYPESATDGHFEVRWKR